MKPQHPSAPVSRRKFLAGGALLGGFFTPSLEAADAPPEDATRSKNAVLNSRRPDTPYSIAEVQNTLYSACLQCNTGCGIKCKIQDGIVSKIEGNPYNPWTLLPHLNYTTHPADAVAVDGAICPKGQSGLQTAYDPHRLRKVLKRAGARGENKWISIPFERAVREICEGGTLFSSVPGEENRQVEGLRELMALRDPGLSKKMAADVEAIWADPTADGKRKLVADFKQKYREHLDKMIDPDHPDLGPKNNQIVCSWGRLKGGRSDFYRRFTAGLGSVNAHGHTTVCQGSLYFTCSAISDQYVAGSFSGGRKFYWQADTENARFVLFVGANLFEANYGPPNRTVRLTDGLASGRTKIAVADPRFSKLAGKAWKWLPLKPGSDTALAMAMIRWILDNERYDVNFLAAANRAAADAVGENSYCNGTWLVRIDDNGQPGTLVRASEVGLREAEERASGDKAYLEKFMVAMVDGQPVALDPNDAESPVHGDLFVDATLPDGSRVKSGLQLLLEASREMEMAEWAELCGVRAEDIVATAHELTSYGKQASVDIHRGPAQHTNGYYAVLGWMSLNMLLGNYDHKGGLIQGGGTYDTSGRGGLFALGNHPDRTTAFGISSIRHGIDYEKTTLFSGYPARRPWYPLASDLYQETIPSIGDAYPYPVKALFLYMGAPTYALPAGHTNIDVLRDPLKLPLFIANDILVGTSSMYADYIFPDLSFLERWEFQGSHFSMPNKVQPLRQPVMPPVTMDCEVYGQSMPMSFESMMLGIAEHLDLPGFGKDAFGPNLDLQHPDDLYLRAIANLAFGDAADGSRAVADANEQEIEIAQAARRHLPGNVFDRNRWRRIVGEGMWPKVVTILNRGGRFEDHELGYKDDRSAHPYGRLLNLYQERTALTIHSGTGEPHPGIARHVPIRDFLGEEPAKQREGHDLVLITHRTISQCKTRTITNPWLRPLMPDNGILVNPQDAERLGLREGDQVKVVSSTNPKGTWQLTDRIEKPMAGKVVITRTLRPGVVSFALGFGHWATGAVDITIDGYVIRGSSERAAGINANAAMWTDSHVRNTCMSDPVGGSVSFYDTHVMLVKVPEGSDPPARAFSGRPNK